MIKEMIDRAKEAYWEHKFTVCFKDTNDVLMTIPPEDAVKWIDDKMAEGELIKRQENYDKNICEHLDRIYNMWRRIRISRSWEIAKRVKM